MAIGGSSSGALNTRIGRTPSDAFARLLGTPATRSDRAAANIAAKKLGTTAAIFASTPELRAPGRWGPEGGPHA